MTNINLKQIKKVFFIGIGGIGISALAKMALSRDMEVLGLNDEESTKTLEPLRDAGVMIYYLNELKELPDADMYVFSDAWVYRGPQFIIQARNTGKPTLSYFEALGLFAKKYKVIAISGTHGKTTTTAMVADILIDANLDPTVVVGSFVKKFGSNFRKGAGEYLVVEADEYNRHFLNFHPYIGAITNIEADHLDCYKDLADIQNAFDIFASKSQNIIKDYSKYLDKVPKLLVPGEHNRQNAATAYAVADFLGINNEIIEKSLSNFSGTWRRLEKRGETSEGAIIYDDYAHHPTEVRASLQALRELYPNLGGQDSKKITVIFQPHLYSRTKALFQEFVKSFNQADQIVLLPIYFARESKDETVSSDVLAEAIRKEGVKVDSFPDFESAEAYVQGLKLGKNDVLVTMGAGEAYKVADQIFNFS